MTREEAIAVLEKEASVIDDDSIKMTAREWDEFDDLKREAIPVAIEALQVEPVKHGEWKYYNFSDINNPYVGWYECTVCKHHEYSERDFCPNCGADMRGEEE